jgi:hypothetical protein
MWEDTLRCPAAWPPFPGCRTVALQVEAEGLQGSQRTTGSQAPPPPVSQARGLVAHKGITVILLTLTLEFLLEDGNGCGRFIKNAPDLSRRPWLAAVPQLTRGRNTMGPVREEQFSSTSEQSAPANPPSPETSVPLQQTCSERGLGRGLVVTFAELRDHRTGEWGLCALGGQRGRCLLRMKNFLTGRVLQIWERRT